MTNLSRKLLSNNFFLIVILCLAAILRIIPAIYTPLIADTAGFQEIGRWVLAGKSPYSSPAVYALYPYPPVWMWFAGVSLWLSSVSNLPFQFLIKLPIILGDLIICILIYLLVLQNDKRKAVLSSFLYAINPVSILITGFHGQFDTLAILFIIFSIYYYKSKIKLVSPLFLSLAIALKGFPILLVPFFAYYFGRNIKDKIIFSVLTILPVLLIILPFLFVDYPSIKSGLFSYSGVTDYGWLSIIREKVWLEKSIIFATLPFVNRLLTFSKLVFLSIYGLCLFYNFKKIKNPSLPLLTALTFCLFLSLYGGISSQYLVWIVPFLIFINTRAFILYSLIASLAIISFYSFFFPQMISWVMPISPQPFETLSFYIFTTILFWVYTVYLLFNKIIPLWFRKSPS